MWVAWAIVTAAFAVGELVTPGLFFLGPVALAGVIALVLALVGAGVAIQLVGFAGAAIGSLAIVRPIAVRHLRMPAEIRTGAAALVGARALVLERVDAHGGSVKIGGETWTARAYLDGQVLEPGTTAEVAKIEGATALVYE
jgi:membrane protein implicated in regulation of membrane protease activity